MKFKFHNIVMPGGRHTMGYGHPLFKNQQDAWNTIKNLEKYFAPHARRNISVVDLGALEGGYAIELARLGFKVTIIEARKENVEKCIWVADQCRLPITVIQDDAKNLFKYGTFDVVLCLGILYHFDEPVKFLRMAARQCNKLMVLNTHYAHMEDPLYDQAWWKTRLGKFIFKRAPWLYPKHHHGLSRIHRNENHVGRWYREYPKEATAALIAGIREAAFSNHRSFWLVKQELEMAVLKAGFISIQQIHDRKWHDRGLFLCEK